MQRLLPALIVLRSPGLFTGRTATANLGASVRFLRATGLPRRRDACSNVRWAWLGDPERDNARNVVEVSGCRMSCSLQNRSRHGRIQGRRGAAGYRLTGVS